MRRLLAAISMVIVVACGEKPAGKTALPVDRDETPTAAPQRNTLTIDPSVRRDLRITTTAVEVRSGADAAAMLGELHVDESAYAEVAPPITAQIMRLHVQTNAAVRRGQALADLRSVDLGRARADYASAEARLELARQTLERKRSLADERIVSRREVEEASAQHSAAEADVRAARAALAAIGVPASGDGGAAFVLRSPVSGTVLERAARVGQQADPGTPLFRIGNLQRLWLVVHAFERDAVRISTDTEARVSLPALPGESFTGRVITVGRQVDPASRTVPVRIDLGNPTGRLRPGMSAKATIPVGTSAAKVVVVPAVALQRVADDWVVFIPRSAGEFEIRPVGRGRDLEGEIEILSGLQGGEIIVVEGAFLLKAEAEKARGAGAPHEHD